MKKALHLLILLVITLTSQAQKTEVQYLSGTGSDHTVKWDFFCTAGMKSNKWSTIEVPSEWEQQGFGAYNYGQGVKAYNNEQGLYKAQ
jgi:hypothetical protein